jgi:Sulfotransferase family
VLVRPIAPVLSAIGYLRRMPADPMGRLMRAASRTRTRASRRARLARTAVAVPRGLRADRLVPAPVFLLSSERSGSTLLRAVLDAHSEIVAPHELHLRRIEITMPRPAKRAMREIGLYEEDLANILWDRLLHLQLADSGKSIVVDKTPHNVRAWPRINGWWPEARYLFLHRHPLRILESMTRARPDIPREDHLAHLIGNVRHLHQAERALDGLVVGYERLTHEPETVTREICTYLGVPWEPEMIDYGARPGRRRYRRGLGDWSPKIKTGQILPDRPLPAPDEVPAELRDACRLLGYRA